MQQPRGLLSSRGGAGKVGFPARHERSVTASPLDAIPRYQDKLTEIRRDLHANPELGLEEHRTSDVVAAKLAEWRISRVLHRRQSSMNPSFVAIPRQTASMTPGRCLREFPGADSLTLVATGNGRHCCIGFFDVDRKRKAR
jgi:hypothetical protein